MEPEISSPPQIDPAPEYRDRKAWLVGFGILEILFGGLCGLLVPLMVLGQSMSARMTGAPPNYRMIAPSLLFYGALAVAFVWLGIGSIQARRWARALLLILSWSWLVTGVISIAFIGLMFSQITRMIAGGNPAMPPAAALAAGVVMMIVMILLLLIVPGGLVLFYRRKDVKATCEARDGAVRWTDACPMPVLGLSLWLGFAAVVMLSLPAAYNSVVPFFGTLLSGATGTLVLLAIVGLWSYAAWSVYRLSLTGWWVALITFCLFLVSNVITFQRIDIMDMYRLMGYPQQQIDQIQQFNLFKGGAVILWSVLFMLPVFGYLLFVKKYFRRPG